MVVDGLAWHFTAMPCQQASRQARSHTTSPDAARAEPSYPMPYHTGSRPCSHLSLARRRITPRMRDCPKQPTQHNTTQPNATTSQEQCQCQRSAAHISLQGIQSGVTSWPYVAQPCWTRCHPGQAKPRCERERPACRSALHEFPEQRDLGVGAVRTCWSWALRSDDLAEPVRCGQHIGQRVD